MARLFQPSDLIEFQYSNVQAAKLWWIKVFDCQEVAVPPDGDSLPSDIVLKMPGEQCASILVGDKAKVKASEFDRPNPIPILYSSKLKQAREYLSSRGVQVSDIQDSGDTQFFEFRDLEGNVVEVCIEP